MTLVAASMPTYARYVKTCQICEYLRIGHSEATTSTSFLAASMSVPRAAYLTHVNKVKTFYDLLFHLFHISKARKQLGRNDPRISNQPLIHSFARQRVPPTIIIIMLNHADSGRIESHAAHAPGR